MVNWMSLLALILRFDQLLVETNGRPSHPYDWKVGVFQYLIGLTIIVSGFVCLEGSTLSLLSKVSPPKLRYGLLHVGTLTTFVGLVGRSLANVHISMVGLSHLLINTDTVNSVVLPLLLLLWVISYFVRRHFFFLI